MRVPRLVALACASLAASAAPTLDIALNFDEGCVTTDNCGFADAVSAREYIESVPKVAGKCENVRVLFRYRLDEVTRCASSDGSVVEGVAIGSLLHKELLNLRHSGDVYLNKATFHYDGEFSGDCHAATIGGSANMSDECTTLKERPYAMMSTPTGKRLFFLPSNPREALKFADLAVQAQLEKKCVVPGKAKEVELYLMIKVGLESTVGVTNATIVFPDQPDCAPRGCDAVGGLEGVKLCLDNARAAPSCKRAVYTRTYLRLGSGPCDPTVPGKHHLNMDTIFADEKALDFEDKHTIVTSVKFGQKLLDNRCTDTVLSLTNSCFDAPSVKSTLREDRAIPYTFTGEEAITADASAPHYIVTTTCDSISSLYGHEMTVKTELTIPHDFAATESLKAKPSESLKAKPSGSLARVPVAALITAAASILGISSL